MVCISDYFKEALGWKPPTGEFRPTADCECSGCTRVLPAERFEMPLIHGRPWLCKDCS